MARRRSVDRTRCSSYTAGHTVHWIQALRTANDPAVAAATRWGTLIAIRGEVLEIRFADGQVARYRHHQPGRLAALTGGTGPVSVNDQYAVLRAGGSCFSVTADTGHPLGPCPTDGATATGA